MDQAAQDEAVEAFCTITGASRHEAEHVLDAHAWDIERSVDFFLDSGGEPMAAQAQAPFSVEEPVEEGDAIDTVQRPAYTNGAADRDLEAALAQSLRETGDEPASARAGPHSVPIEVSDGEENNFADEEEEANGYQHLEALAAFEKQRRAVAAQSSDEAMAGPSQSIFNGHTPAGPRVRRNRPSGATAAIQQDWQHLAAMGQQLGVPNASDEDIPGGMEAPLLFQPAAATAAGAASGEDDDGMLDLPAGINIEEARMLEAAMLGIPYEGRMPDFSAGPLPAELAQPLDPAVLHTRSLREEQDWAFQQSLETDRQKAAAAEQARRESEEADRQKQQKAELQALLQRSQQEDYERQIAAKQASLPPEPEAGADGVVTVMVRMPDGSRQSRRFLRSSPVQALFDFVDIQSKGTNLKPSSYNLGAQFPRRIIEDGSASSFQEAGLDGKQETVFIELH